MRRSLAGPLILILLGVLFLLMNLGYNGLTWGVFPALLRFWPLILVAIGIGIALTAQRGASSHIVGWVFVALLVILIIAAVASPRTFERWGSSAVVSRSFSTTAEENRATEAEINLSTGSAQVAVTGGGESLFTANARYESRRGDYKLGREWIGKTLRLDYHRDARNSWGWFDFTPERHDVSLGETPMGLSIRVGSGKVDLRPGSTPLKELELSAGSGQVAAEMENANAVTCSSLRADVGSGRLSIREFGNLRSGSAELRVGSGTILLETGLLMKGENVARITVGSGHARVILPAGTAYRIKGSIGSGSVRVNGTSHSGRDLNRMGAIESPGYSNAPTRIEIIVQVGSGFVEVSL